MVITARFSDESEARMAASILSGEGIDAVVTDIMPTRALGARAATLAVDPDEVERAVAMLERTPAARWLLDRQPR